VRHQVGFTEARGGFVPVLEGPNGDLVFQEGAALGGSLASGAIRLARGTQEAIGCSRTDRQQLCPDLI